MEIYIEYAFLQNFFFDGMLLFLALKASKTKVRWKRLFLSAFLGGVFALAFPYFLYYTWLTLLLKVSVGLLLCLIPSALKTKKERSRYAFTTLFFFVFTFAFGGALLTIATTTIWVVLGFLFLSCCALLITEKLLKKGRISTFLYECILFTNENWLKANGFLDSGNSAQKNGIPVCFLSPSVFFRLIKEEGGIHGRDEMKIFTVSGEKRVVLYAGEILIKKEKEECEKKVYFALNRNSISTEYEVLLNARIFD